MSAEEVAQLTQPELADHTDDDNAAHEHESAHSGVPRVDQPPGNVSQSTRAEDGAN
jgi:hypothetical protein